MLVARRRDCPCVFESIYRLAGRSIAVTVRVNESRVATRRDYRSTLSQSANDARLVGRGNEFDRDRTMFRFSLGAIETGTRTSKTLPPISASKCDG